MFAPSRPLVVVSLALLAAGVSADAPLLRSTTVSWDEIQTRPSPNGRSRSLFRSATATLDELEIHVTTLPPGQASHPPHTHPEEEVIIVKEGTIEVFQAGATRRVGPGAVLFMASQEAHNVTNVGETPATYHVMQWFSPGMKKKAETK
jgi:XRE family transcriptional regulator, regulator of sulfur utilization